MDRKRTQEEAQVRLSEAAGHVLRARIKLREQLGRNPTESEIVLEALEHQIPREKVDSKKQSRKVA